MPAARLDAKLLKCLGKALVLEKVDELLQQLELVA